jgi:hypothetical protein
MKAKFVSEAIHFQRGLDPHAALDIGKQEFRDQAKLKKFAEDNGYRYGVTKRGTAFISIPVDYEENLGYNYPKGYQYDWIKDMEYTITYPTDEGWSDTPISLRKRWMNREGKNVKQALIDRFATVEEAIDRIKKQIPGELKKSGPAERR